MRSLRGRLILSHIIPILIILPVMGFGLVSLIRTQVLISNLSSELTNQALLVASLAGNYTEIWYDPGRAQAFVADVSPTLLAQITLIDNAGHILVSSNPQDQARIGQQFNLPAAAVNSQHPQMVISYSTTRQGEISDVIVPVVQPARGVIGYIRLANPFASIDAGVQNLQRLTIWVVGGGLIAGLVMGLIFAIQLEKPLKRTTQAVYNLINGHQSTPLLEQGPTEIQTLAKAVNILVDRLNTLESNRRKLLANLVHELGRPLGAMQSAVQALLSGADQDPSLRRELLQGIGDELKRLRNLLDDLAHLHDQVVGPLELNLQNIDLKEWLPIVIAPWREAAAARKQDFQVNLAEQLPQAKIDPERFGQALGNLLSNAVSYTQNGGTIQVEANQTNSSIRLSVTDNGPGITREEQVKIFTPFYRGKAARRFSDGMGLGLSIAKDIVIAHGGSLVLESGAGQGSQFIIDIPS
jgi:signal transduction histidine kinase